MKHLFVMDPLASLHVGGDSTYVTMREACDRGHLVRWCTPDAMYIRDGQAFARASAVVVGHTQPWFDEGPPEDLCLADVDVVWMRKDPPFDMTYILATYHLDMAHTLVVNAPAGLKLFNEKLWAMADFAKFQPKTLLSRDAHQIASFVRGLPGRTVLKPWDGNGGRGVLVTNGSDRNLASMIDVVSAGGTTPLIAQEFIDAVEQGDKRILLFDGEPVGAMLRIPQAADYRANMHVGATVEGCDLDARDQEICAALREPLKRHGQVFVGIDVIAGFLTEINVTSPTGIRELNQLYGTRLEADLVDCVEGLAGRNS